MIFQHRKSVMHHVMVAIAHILHMFIVGFTEPSIDTISP